MNSSDNDFNQLRKALKSFGPRHVAVIILIIAVLYGLQNLSKLPTDNIDRTDYKLVADQYIRKNTVIAKVLGKVETVSHIGVGGDAGRISYNTFSIRGADGSGVCYCTMTRDDDGSWYITDATLTAAGREYALPVKRTGKVPFKVFE